MSLYKAFIQKFDLPNKENSQEGFERSMTDVEIEATNAFMEIHYKLFEERDRDWNVLGYCSYFSDDIHLTIESGTSDSVDATGIKRVTDLLHGFRDA